MRTYDPTQVTLVFANQNIDGFGPGTFVKVSRNDDVWSFQPSLSGRGARSRNPNKSGRFEFTLLASSPANALLSNLATADENAGTGVGSCQVKDRATLQAKCSAQSAWIIRPPDFERQKEVGEITWVIESDEVIIVHDGVIDTP